jgi:hypothetical protein
MQSKYKKHQKVLILHDPDPEYIEYNLEENEEFAGLPVKKGMSGKINLILPNGKYHIGILNKEGKVFAYVPMDEDSICEDLS